MTTERLLAFPQLVVHVRESEESTWRSADESHGRVWIERLLDRAAGCGGRGRVALRMTQFADLVLGLTSVT